MTITTSPLEVGAVRPAVVRLSQTPQPAMFDAGLLHRLNSTNLPNRGWSIGRWRISAFVILDDSITYLWDEVVNCASLT